MKMRTSSLIVFVIILGFFSFLGVAESVNLKINYYDDTCPYAEGIVRSMTWKIVSKKPFLIPRFLRMQFHDCFVRGCEGSILLDSKKKTAEKNATPNLSLSGTFEVIEKIKEKLEEICPGVVSCSDILNLVTRDAVSYQFKKSVWEVETGRRDGRVSKASEVGANIPPPSSNFSSLKNTFAQKTLSVHDLVVLSGGHTIGVAHCNLFSSRLYNFTGKGDSDPSLDPTYMAFLKTKCRNLSDNVTFVENDFGSSRIFDNNYYKSLKARRGLFASDAALLTDGEARDIVDQLLQSPNKFFEYFGESMKRLSSIGVLTGKHGEIRKKCNMVNNKD